MKKLTSNVKKTLRNHSTEIFLGVALAITIPAYIHYKGDTWLILTKANSIKMNMAGGGVKYTTKYGDFLLVAFPDELR